MPSPLRSRSLIGASAIVFVASAIVAALPAAAQLSRGGGGTTGTVTDVLATIPTTMFSVPSTVTSTTRTWSNLAFTAMGGTSSLAKISRVDMTCVLETETVTMQLEITTVDGGDVRVRQTVEGIKPSSPPRTQTISLPAGSTTLTAIDDVGTQTFQVTAETAAVLRRAGDLWNPVLTMLGQFESVESVKRVSYGGKECNALILGKPRLPGLESGTLYLDATTNMPVGQETNVVRDILISGRSSILEWQTVSSIQVPKVIQMDGPDGITTLRITRLSLTLSTGTLH